MCGAGSCASAPLFRLERAKARVMKRESPRTAWSQVASVSSISSSSASTSTSVMALLRRIGWRRRLSAWQPSPLPPTSTRVPPPWKASSSSPCRRNSERRRAKMARDLGKLALLVRERGLDDQKLQIGDAVHFAPQRIVRPGIAGKDEARFATIQVVAHRGHGMARRQRRDAARAQTHGLAERDFLIAQKRRLGARDLAEVRPDRPVEEVVAHDLDRRPAGIYGQRLRTHAADRVDQKWNRGDVIEVRMRDEDAIDLRQLGERQVANAGAGVDQDVAVDQERGGAQVPAADSAGGPEDAQAHPYFSAKTVTPSQSAGGGLRRFSATNSA